MFTASVANIGPHDEIVVAIVYQETVRYDEGTFRLRFPMAITPRYAPGDGEPVVTHVVERSDGHVLPVHITVDLDAGVALSALSSTYHPMSIEPRGDYRYRLTLQDGPVPAARDFELAWTPNVGSAPATALFTETKGGKTYALLMALPPASAKPGRRVPREVTYIIDTSGSMEGVSMAQARDALAMALDRLQPGDRFNVIEFNSTTHSLFAAPVGVDAATMQRAKQFVAGLRARGGTEMLPALEIALAGPREASMLRQVVFLTDGAVSNEDQILKLVGERIGDRRLFTVGIGPAPNMFFMTKAAQFGRGTYTAIGDVREVQEKMTALFRKLESPALTDITVLWPAGADVWPRVVPDLYAGEPVLVSAAFDAGAAAGNIAVSGRRDGASWGTLLPKSTASAESGIGVLWARAKIDALMDAGRRGAPEPAIRAAVIDVALTHHLVSKFTSLVAVDVTPTKAAGIPASKTAVPGNVPEGLTGFDQLPRTATPAPLMMLLARLRWRWLPCSRSSHARRGRSPAWLPSRSPWPSRTTPTRNRASRRRRRTTCCCRATTTATSVRSTPFRRTRRRRAGSCWSRTPQASTCAAFPTCRDSGPNSCASSSAQRSTTARRCNPRSASCSTSTCRRPRCARARSPRSRCAVAH
jgi:Ca-activated chloride channel family protein